MIIEYHRPERMDQAIQLLSREDPITIPIGGGSHYPRGSEELIAVVDLQALGMDGIQKKGTVITVGATERLQGLIENEHILPGLKTAIKHEATYILRQVATAAGSLVSADGRSPYATAMLALDAQVCFLPDETLIPIGEVLSLYQGGDQSRLIGELLISTNVKLDYQYIARTPADLPIVCVAVAQWPGGRTRVALGGFGKSPKLAMDGPNALGAATAARDAFREAGNQWASATYRSEVAAILTERCLRML